MLELSETFRLLIFFALLRDGFKKEKKKLMEFSIKLAGWVLDALIFH